jgi:hypothetical protein
MRKTIIPAIAFDVSPNAEWLPLDKALVEVTSEKPDHPIERALDCRSAGGWRATIAGEQRIRIAFHEPVTVHRIPVALC